MEEMKELIIQSLETKGVLGQIRAHLRSAVFKVVDEQDQQFNTGCGLKWENKTLYKILETKIGTLLAEIIREFMEYFRMDYSLSIFIPECGISPERLNRKEILGKLGIMSNPQNDKFTAGLHLPLLYYIINYFISELKENPNKVIDSIKKYQNDIEAKSDELIENNMTEYFKNQKIEEENIPLSNNSRDVNPPSKKEEKKEEEKKEEKKEVKLSALSSAWLTTKTSTRSCSCFPSRLCIISPRLPHTEPFLSTKYRRLPRLTSWKE